MKLSARARYAARILLELAQRKENGPVTASLLSRQTGVSTQFIEQILRPLRQAGITSSVRGALGGHILVRPPEAISIGDIVRIMEGGIQLTVCNAVGPGSCKRYNSCLTRGAWSRLSQAFEQEMDGISLQDLLKDSAGADICMMGSLRDPVAG
ncbi:Rrf2 family transcriptional regulator [Desulfovibrio sp. OttesenSCG-928-I05]|nr:Rrf2 family transcriptional regulator [Desulfovibrio sp. OttesenSCG-928-I05]